MTLDTELYDISFAKNPMVVKVTVGRKDFAEGTTFRTCVVKVSFGSREYQFVSECDNGDTIPFDISTAFRAELSYHEVDVNAISNPVVSGKITALLRYMQDGEMFDHSRARGTFGWGKGNTTFYALRGGVPESVRLLKYTTPYAAVMGYASLLSTKPTSTEIRNIGDKIFTSKYSNHAIQTNQATVTEEGYSSIEGRSIYAESSPFRQELVFLNSLGVLESVSALTRESLSYNIESDTYTISHIPSFIPSPRTVCEKSGGTAEWQMSSGYVSRDWGEWWATEFLMSYRHWLRLSSGALLPVVVEPKDKDTQIYNRAKPGLISVEFTVKSAVEGKF